MAVWRAGVVLLIGLALGAGVAVADDDGGRGGGRGAPGEGPRGGGDDRPGAGPPATLRLPSLPWFAPPPPARRQARRPAAAQRLELVVAVPSAADLDRLAADGFTVLARARVDLLAAELAKLAAPAGTGLDAARAAVVAAVPDAVVDAETAYRAEAADAAVPPPCAEPGCAALRQVGWRLPPDECTATPVIGMVDSGVNLDQPVLAGRSIEVLPLVSGDRRPAETLHGTAVAALLVGRSDSRTPGLLPRAHLVVAAAFHRRGGVEIADAFDLVRAIDALVGRGVGVVNLSLAGPANLVVERAVAAAQQRRVVLVAAAGNGGPAAPAAYPAAYPGVVAVTAVDGRGRVYARAGAGDHVALAAPGVQITVARSIRGARPRSGTSYAAPFVAAAIAVRHPRSGPATPDGTEAVAATIAAARDLGPAGRDASFGHGLVQAPAACADAETAAIATADAG